MSKVSLPQCHESEKQVIGSMLMDSTVIPDILDMLTARDFTRESNSKVFDSIRKLYNSKKPIDLTTVGQDCGTMAYVAELADIPTSAAWKHHAELVREVSIRRNGIQLCAKMQGRLQQRSESITDTLDEAQREILTLGSQSNRKTGADMSELCGDALHRYREAANGKLKPGIISGLNRLDVITGGFRESKYILVAARPGQGKTALMVTMARNQAKAGHRPFILSMEMPADELIDRIIAQEADVTANKLLQGKKLEGDEWQAVVDAAETVSGWGIKIDDESGLHISEVKRRIRQAVRDGHDIVYIDQLSQMQGPGFKEYEINTGISRELARLKKEVKIPIVLLAQINRESNKGSKDGNNEPSLHQLKSTGALEEDCDIALLLHRPYEYSQDQQEKHDAILKIAKHRGGPTGKINIYWQGHTTMFRDGYGV